jgi:molybdopterin/thiamine biosynthesis adenylyltransferase
MTAGPVGDTGRPASLTPQELERYAWQQDVSGFGPHGQQRLKAARVLVSRAGGVGGAAATYLAAAGIGRLVIAHAGPLRLDDLNRQTLMSTAGIGRSRVEQAQERLLAINPEVEIEIVPENVCPENAIRLVAGCDLVVSAAPLFEERLLLNREAVRRRVPLVDAAMYDLEARLLAVVPGGGGPCLACLCPVLPPHWRRRFPVFGAVAGAIGALAAMQAISLLTGIAAAPAGILVFDCRTMTGRTVPLGRRADCEVCGCGAAAP